MKDMGRNAWVRNQSQRNRCRSRARRNKGDPESVGPELFTQRCAKRRIRRFRRVIHAATVWPGSVGYRVVAGTFTLLKSSKQPSLRQWLFHNASTHN